MISKEELEGKIYEDERNHVRYVRAVCEYCGHTEYFLQNKPRPCSHCDRTVYPTDRTKFKDKITKLKRKRDKEI